jgi:hypothetical protein
VQCEELSLPRLTLQKVALSGTWEGVVISLRRELGVLWGKAVDNNAQIMKAFVLLIIDFILVPVSAGKSKHLSKVPLL